MNNTQRLLDQFASFDPDHIEQVFGGEFLLGTPAPDAPRAPVERVALITESFLPKVDGVSKSALLTLRYLQQTGREVLVFAPDIAPERIFDTRVVPLPSVGFPRIPETRMALPNTIIARELRDFQPDLIHMFSPALMSMSGVIAGRRMGLPIVANYQTDLPGFARAYGWAFGVELSRTWLRYLHNRCHVNLVPSAYAEADLRTHGFKRLRRWGRGVDSQRFNPSRRSTAGRTRLLHGRAPGSLLCVYVGRLATEKSVDLLLEVAQLEGVALTIIGDGAERENLEQLFAGTGTHFTGYLFGEDLPAAFANADVFLFPGAQETFGQVVQEAMASGLAAVVTDQGGVSGLVEVGETGFHAQHNAASFAAYVRILRDDPDLRQRMGQRARSIAEARPWEVTLAQLETHYAEAVMLNRRSQQMNQPRQTNIINPAPLFQLMRRLGDMDNDMAGH